jgi:hypothetical protein
MMEDFGNGFGDWNLSWDKWRAGSVIQAGTGTGTADGSTEAARLDPGI